MLGETAYECLKAEKKFLVKLEENIAQSRKLKNEAKTAKMSEAQ